MPNITPNSTVRLLHNCPLDKSYDHTIYFSNVTAQTEYFQGLTKSGMVFSAVNYTRKDRGLKLEAPVGSNLYDCNYMMFKNTSFENKWFYAFITKVEYINNITWEIEFELDDMQTWFFDYELERCFVEREHTATDVIGEHLVPEHLDLGDYISGSISRCYDGDEDVGASYLEGLSIIFACTFDENLADFAGGVYSGIYSGLYFKRFDLPISRIETDIQPVISQINTWLTALTSVGKSAGIVTAFLMPTTFCTNSPTGHSTYVTVNKPKKYGNIYGFTPKNNKLYTYPYNFLYVTNFQGQYGVFPYEYFDVDGHPNECQFRIGCNFGVNPTVVLSPTHFKGVDGMNYDEKLTLGGYPQLPYATDVFRAWLANGAGDTLVNALSTVGTYTLAGGMVGAAGGAGVGAVPGAAIGAVIGVGASVLHALFETGRQAQAPPQSHSGAGSTTLASMDMLDFGFMEKHIRPEFARIIDDYFNMFGYAIHRNKIPNRNVRPHWTYTKTIGCCIVGSLPSDSAKHICDIYNAGITFWKNGNEVGHYELDNRPT